MDRIRRYQSIILAVILLFLSGCRSAEPVDPLLQKFTAYQTLYQQIYGRQASGNLRHIIDQFYETFFSNNDLNFGISAYQLPKVARNMEGWIKTAQQASEKEPKLADFDPLVQSMLTVFSQVHEDLKAVEKYYSKSKKEEIDQEEVKKLFLTADANIAKLDGLLLRFQDGLQKLQEDYEQELLSSYTQVEQRLSYLLLEGLIRSERVSSMLSQAAEGFTIDLAKLEENILKIAEFPKQMEEHAQDAAQLVAVAMTAEEVKEYRENLDIVLTQSAALLDVLKENETPDSYRLDQVRNAYLRMINLYNKQ